MVIPKAGRAFLIAFFVLAPMMGLVIGIAAGYHLVESAPDRANTATERMSPPDQVSPAGPTSETVGLPGGETVALRDLAPNRKVAIVVMKDVRCPVCQRQLKALEPRLSEIKRNGGAVFGLSDAPRCANEALMQRLGLDFPIVSDADQSVLKAFEMDLPQRRHVMPGVIFIDEQGDVSAVYRGRSPGQSQGAMISERLR